MATTLIPGSDSLAAENLIDNLGPFMGAPREIRDKIYRFLLSTKYTQHRLFEPGIDTLEYGYMYRFHTSILFINRQIYHEASNIFYMENLFVRVNTVTPGPLFQPDAFEPFGDNGYVLPICSDSSKALACTRHIMEIDLIPDSLSSGQRRNRHLIIACDDLPMFCRYLLSCLLTNGQPDEGQMELMLQRLELWVIIGDEVLNPLTYQKSADFLNAATKHAAAGREGPTKIPRIAVERSAAFEEERNDVRYKTVNRTTEPRSRLSEMPSLFNTPRLRRLLEPLRALHSIGFSYIDAPISERHRQEIQTMLSRARPSIHEVFSTLLPVYKEAMMTFGAGHFALAIQKFRRMLDLCYRLRLLYSRDAPTELATGLFAGLSLEENIGTMLYTSNVALAEAYLKFPKDVQHVRAAQALLQPMVNIARDGAGHGDAHECARVQYLAAEAWEALDQLGGHNGRPRSEALRDVIQMLMQALQHEPKNLVFQHELKRRQKEKAAADMMEEVREMEKARVKCRVGSALRAARLHERGKKYYKACFVANSPREP